MITHLEVVDTIKIIKSNFGKSFKEPDSALIGTNFGKPEYTRRAELIPVDPYSTVTVTRNPLMNKFWVDIKAKRHSGSIDHGFLLQEGKTLLVKDGKKELSVFNSPIQSNLPNWVVDAETRVRYLKQLAIGVLFGEFRLKVNSYESSLNMTNDLLALPRTGYLPDDINKIIVDYGVLEYEEHNASLCYKYIKDFLLSLGRYLGKFPEPKEEAVFIFSQLFRLASVKEECNDELFNPGTCYYVMKTMKTSDVEFKLLDDLVRNTFRISLSGFNNKENHFSLKNIV